jgi:hypothetical protein
MPTFSVTFIRLLVSHMILCQLREDELLVSFSPTPKFCLEAMAQNTPFLSSYKNIKISGKVLGLLMDLQCI